MKSAKRNTPWSGSEVGGVVMRKALVFVKNEGDTLETTTINTLVSKQMEAKIARKEVKKNENNMTRALDLYHHHQASVPKK